MKKLFAAILALTLIFLAACGMTSSGGMTAASSASPAAVKSVTPEAAYARLNGGGAVFLDVRTAKEYSAGHIRGALLLPNADIGSKAPALLPVKDAEIIVYCDNGMSSADAAKKLANLGYSNVSDMGGVGGWTYGLDTGDWTAKSGTWSSFRAADINGVPVDESIFAGHRLSMINVWATFCGPCLSEMPDLGKLSAELASSGVQIIGVVADALNSDGSVSQSQVAQARKLAEKTGAAYTHLLPSADLLKAGISGVSSVPTTIFVDEKGNQVGKAYVGSRSAADWKNIILSLTA